MEKLLIFRGRHYAGFGLAALLLIPENARAYCGRLKQDLQEKQSTYESYTKKNEERLKSITDRETTCNTEGSILSQKLASLAASLSCTAQTDAAGLNREVRNLGTTCQSNFQSMKELQITMRSEFEKVQQDLESGVTEIESDQDLSIVCHGFLVKYKKLVTDYKELDQKIVDVQEHAHTSENTYKKFAGTAENLRQLTATGGLHCEDQPSSGPAGGANDPLKAAGFSGTSENPVSDVTGIKEDRDKRSQFKVADAALPAKKVDAFGPPKEKADAASSAQAPSPISVSVPTVEAAPADSTITRDADPSGTFSARGAIGLSAETAADINKAEALRKKFGAVDSSVGSVLWEEKKDSAAMTLQAAPAANAPSPAQPSSPEAVAAGKPGTPAGGSAGGFAGDITPLPVVSETSGRHLASALYLLSEANAASASAAESNETLFERVHHRYRASEQFRRSASAARFFR